MHYEAIMVYIKSFLYYLSPKMIKLKALEKKRDTQKVWDNVYKIKGE